MKLHAARTCSLLLLVLTACASTESKSKELSGFLGQHPKLAPSKVDADTLVWIREDEDYGAYSSVLIDPVSVIVTDHALAAGLDQAELEELGELYRAALESELGRVYEIVQTAGAKTLRFRAALTGVLAAKDESTKQRRASELFDLGGASTEIEITNAATGKLLAVAASTKSAQAVSTGMLTYTTKGQAQEVFREWAKRTRLALGRLAAGDESR